MNQIKKLLADVDRSTLQGKRDYALLNLLIRTGLRTIEVVRANIEDMRQESGEAVLWIQGKGRDGKDEFVLLTKNTLEPIRVYLEARGEFNDKDPLFASLSDRNRNQRLTTYSISRLVKRYLKGIGLNNGRLTAHSLRHTAITLSLLGGATIQEAQALGRHADINTTLVYAHNLNRIAQAPEGVPQTTHNNLLSTSLKYGWLHLSIPTRVSSLLFVFLAPGLFQIRDLHLGQTLGSLSLLGGHK